MSDTPTTDNKTADTADVIIDDGTAAAVQVVETLIIGDIPLLGLPVVSPLFKMLISWVATYFEKAFESGVTFQIIDRQVGKEESTLGAALKAIAVAQKSGDPNALKIAIQNYANANSAFVHDDGSSVPK